ncbi:protein of unknown function DUF1058 [Candidatus Magnetoovum chiemensis]|nr:protein of unknown function DUF1058 [Candidatus Magnetoovum chiemensis]
MLIILTANSAYPLCVSKKEANLRSAPDANAQKTWEVYFYMPFEKIGEKGEWYNVKDVDGDTHWINKSVVSSDFKCAVVSKPFANIRTEPKTSAPKAPLKKVDKYYSFKVAEIKDKWVKVEDELGNKGWISKNLLWIQ